MTSFDLETGSSLLFLNRSLPKPLASRTLEDDTEFVLMLEVAAVLR